MFFTASPSPIHPVGCGVGVEANLWYRRRMEGWPCLWPLRTVAPPNLGFPQWPGCQSLPPVAPTLDTPLPYQPYGYKSMPDVLHQLNSDSDSETESDSSYY